MKLLIILFFALGLLLGSAKISYAIMHIGTAHIGTAHIGSVAADLCTGTSTLPTDAYIGNNCACGNQAGSTCGGSNTFPLYAGTYNGLHYMTTPSGCTNLTPGVPTVPTCAGGSDPSMIWATSRSTAATTPIIPVPSEVYAGGTNGQAATIANTSGSIAAAFCYNMRFGGYADWYLPADGEGESPLTVGELYNVLYVHSNRYSPPGSLGGFQNSNYASSTEYSTNGYWRLAFNGGAQSSAPRPLPDYIRCVRSY